MGKKIVDNNDSFGKAAGGDVDLTKANVAPPHPDLLTDFDADRYLKERGIRPSNAPKPDVK